MDELRIYNRQLSALEVQSLAQSSHVVANLMAIPAQRRSPARQRQLLEHYVLTTDSAFAAVNRQVTEWRGQEVNLLTDIPEVMAMQELPADQSRRTFILEAGRI